MTNGRNEVKNINGKGCWKRVEIRRKRRSRKKKK